MQTQLSSFQAQPTRCQGSTPMPATKRRQPRAAALAAMPMRQESLLVGLLALLATLAASSLLAGCMGFPQDFHLVCDEYGYCVPADHPDALAGQDEDSDSDSNSDDDSNASDDGDANANDSAASDGTDATGDDNNDNAGDDTGNNDDSSDNNDTGNTGGTGNTGDNSGNVDTGADGCGALTVTRDTNVDGFNVDNYRWYDAGCQVRTAAMVPNTTQDAAGHWGGYMRQLTYAMPGGETRIANSSHSLYPGFGVVVNHFQGGVTVSNWYQGLSTSVQLEGAHHAIHEYSWRYPIQGSNVTVTVQWFFATGRSHPLYIITYDTSEAAPNAVRADSRSPYGDLSWDGGGNVNVDGVGWGDRYKFTSLDSPITLNSGWDYTQANTIPYVREWAVGADAEMGLVQTQTYLQHDAGSMYFYGSWEQRNDNGPMPEAWNWPYQLNQYELPYGSRSKRLSWGMNYGAVGNTSVDVYGADATFSGYPYQSYSVYVVLDPHSANPVFEQVAEVEAVQDTFVSASTGTVRTQGPAGIGRNDNATYEPVGYNPIYGTWELDAGTEQGGSAEMVAFNMNTTGSNLNNPIIVVHGWTRNSGPQTVRINGQDATPGNGYYASVDTARNQLWVTLAGTLSGSIDVVIR